MARSNWRPLWLVVLFASLFAMALGCGEEKDKEDNVLDASVDGGDAGGETDLDPGEATITATPEEGPSPLQVDLTCTASGGQPPYRYFWEFGDGMSSTVRDTSHTYTVIGVYTAVCTVTDDNGDEFQGRADITVEDPDITAGPVIDELRVNTGQAPDVPTNCAVVGQDMVQLMVVAHDASESGQAPDVPDGGPMLDGGPDLDPLIYQWVFESQPPGSKAELNNASSFNPTFMPDREGTYVARVFVSDDQAGALSLVTGTIEVMAGVGNRVVPTGGGALGEGQVGEIHPFAAIGTVVNRCGGRAGGVDVIWQGDGAVPPQSLNPGASPSSKEEDTLGQVRLVGVRNGCPPVPGNGAITAIPYHSAADSYDWYPEMVGGSWNWPLVVGPPHELGVNLQQDVPVLDAAGDSGAMTFEVNWVDRCGNVVTGGETTNFGAVLNGDPSCRFSSGGTLWQGDTDTTSWPTISCDASGEVSVELTGLPSSTGWSGDCLLTDLSYGSWSHGSIYGPEDYWGPGYYSPVGPYEDGFDTFWFDGEEIPAWGWQDWFYAYQYISDSDLDCSRFRANPTPVYLRWHQAHDLSGGTGGFFMASNHAPYHEDFDMASTDESWFPREVTPAYDGTLDGQDVWTGRNGWRDVRVEVTSLIANHVCRGSMGGAYLDWMYYVGENTPVSEAYWMIEGVGLWSRCDNRTDSMFLPGPYLDPIISDYYDGVNGCETQPPYFVLRGYDANGNLIPGAIIDISFTGPGTTTVAEVWRGRLVSSDAGTAEIELGPQGDAWVFFGSDAEGTVDVTATADAAGTDATASLDIFTEVASEEGTACSNAIDDDCDGSTDCDDPGCASAPACMPDLAFDYSDLNFYVGAFSDIDHVEFGYRIINNGVREAGEFEVALYIVSQGSAPSGTPVWTYSGDYSSGALHGPIEPGATEPAFTTISDDVSPYTDTVIPAGDYTAHLVIDSTVAVDETDEANNLVSQDFSVGPNLLGYDLLGSYAQESVPNVDVHYFIENDGNFDVDLVSPDCVDVTFFFMASGETPNATGSNAVASEIVEDVDCTIAAGSYSTLVATLDASSLTSSVTYDIWYRIDTSDNLAESDETDNESGPITWTAP